MRHMLQLLDAERLVRNARSCTQPVKVSIALPWPLIADTTRHAGERQNRPWLSILRKNAPKVPPPPPPPPNSPDQPEHQMQLQRNGGFTKMRTLFKDPQIIRFPYNKDPKSGTPNFGNPPKCCRCTCAHAVEPDTVSCPHASCPATRMSRQRCLEKDSYLILLPDPASHSELGSACFDRSSTYIRDAARSAQSCSSSCLDFQTPLLVGCTAVLHVLET